MRRLRAVAEGEAADRNQRRPAVTDAKPQTVIYAHGANDTLLYRIEVDPGEYTAEFRICEQRTMGSDSWEVVARGGLKWDGCCNWETAQPMMMHACEPRHLFEFADALQKLWENGASLIEHWNVNATFYTWIEKEKP
jgi:hypothetical protein